MLELTRPIICFDLETTGIDPVTDRIWQFGALKVHPDGTEKEWSTLVNPEIEIPIEVVEATKSEVRPHGITMAELANAPLFKTIAPKLAAAFDGCDLAGYNIRSFDAPLLQNEFARAGIQVDLTNSGMLHIDAYRLYMKVRPRNLTSFVQDMTGVDISSQAHDAMHDARNTWLGLRACLEKYPHLPREPQALHSMLFERDGDSLAGGKFYFKHNAAHFNFGKHKDRKLEDVARRDRGYLQWAVSGNFEPEVKRILVNALAGTFPKA